MRTKAVLFTIFAATLFATATFISVIFNTAPTTLGVIILFYASLIITILGLFFLVGYAVSFFKYHSTPPWQVTVSLVRVGIILALSLAVVMALRSYQLMNWATFLVILAISIMAEFMGRKYTVKIKQPRSKDIPI